MMLLDKYIWVSYIIVVIGGTSFISIQQNPKIWQVSSLVIAQSFGGQYLFIIYCGDEEVVPVEGFPSVYCEYVLLPLVNKEAALAYGRAE